MDTRDHSGHAKTARISVRKRPLVCLAAVAALASGRWPTAAEPVITPLPSPTDLDGTAQIRLLAVNDFHGWLSTGRIVDGRPVGGGAFLAAYVARLRAARPEATLVLHAGDMVGASPAVSALFQDEPAVQVMEAVGFDVGVAGNHEFDEGVPELHRLLTGGCHPTTAPRTGCFPGTSFPTLAANVIDAATGQPLLRPYQVFALQGVKLGIIGVVTTETPAGTGGSTSGLRFLDEAETINRYVDELRTSGVNAIVVLAHLGGVAESPSGPVTGAVADLAARVDDAVSVIVSAHTHRGYAATVAGKLVSQAWAYGEGLAAISLAIDRTTGAVVHTSAELVRTWNDAAAPDERVAALVARAEALAAPILAEQIGIAAGDITRAAGPSGEQVLGNLIADAYRWRTAADIAFAHPRWNWADLPAGDVTLGDLFLVQPANDDLLTLRLTGAQLLRLLEAQWRPDRTRILHPSGLRYDVDLAAPPGARVRAIRLPDAGPITPDSTVTVTMPRFLAGGDGFAVPTDGLDRRSRPKDLDALLAYVRQLPQPFAATIEGRIRVVS